MKIKFTKMQSCGNDYVYIDCIAKDGFDFDGFTSNQIKDLVVRLSKQHYGIGSDGVIFICKSDVADAKMRMFNADGSEGRMCGNGIRCVAKYVHDNYAKKRQLNIETLSGIKNILIDKDKITVNMGKAKIDASKTECLGYKVTCIDMGNPHCVVFQKDIDNIDLAVIGPKFENHAMFTPDRVNTEFAEIVDKDTLKMRVWERGSGETLACGTGACAVAVAGVLNGHYKKGENINVLLKGGNLIINYTDGCVLMTGDAQKVFEGVIEI